MDREEVQENQQQVHVRVLHYKQRKMLIVEEHQSRFHEKITGKELHATGVKHKVQT